MTAERSEVQWGRTAIAYAIQRSDRRATVSVAVEPTGRVVLTAPRTASVERLDRVVRAKAGWIIDRLRRRRELPRITPREFVSGETHVYLGRQYRLRVVEGGEPGVRLLNGRLVAGVERGLDEAELARTVRHGLIVWYRDHAEERLHLLVAEWASRIGVAVPGLRIRDQHRRWGSCDRTGLVRLNWRIAQAPVRLIEYVVAHELVHLRHADHTRAFWAALAKVMPDYEARRDELRRVGAAFDW